MIVIEYHYLPLGPGALHEIVRSQRAILIQRVDGIHVPSADPVTPPARSGGDQHVIGAKLAYVLRR
jgi:hypothetical protein